MNLLLLDTSSANLSLSVVWKDKLIAEYNRRMRFGASSALVVLERYLRRFNLDLNRLDALAIGAGPGSFTGLRIGFSLVKALSLALNKPVISPGSFISLAQAFKDRAEKIAVITDARRNLIYAASFVVRGGEIKQEDREKLTGLADFLKTHKDRFFLTYDPHIRAQALRLFPGLKFHLGDIYPRTKYFLPFIGRQYAAKKFTRLEDLHPLYLHPQTCQIRNR